ncbi:MAG TPA: GNAT family N-acetyltransferase [Steroidobacteraceae bacterium]|nr:GNAT family N-acetyltransferase [Steroidobacteraceae bacterium]
MRTNISTSITDIDPAAWDALDAGDVPFLRHAFLAGLEATGCVGRRTGWIPAPVTLHDEHGLAAAAPVYVKTHSMGEFVFDFSWAQAYAQHGLEYYPKLVVGVPFTPATAPRLLIRPGVDAAVARRALVRAIEELAESRELSSIHGLFVGDADRQAFADAGWLARFDIQFHWANQGFRDYEHFLEGFTAKFRKNARRERRRVAEAGIHVDTLLGPDLDRRTVDEVYDLHRDTFHRHGHDPYLTREFFRLLPRALGEQFMVKRARLGEETVAAAVFYWNRAALYGRYWGTREQFHSLHFELCYHQGIDFCIERGIGRFEPGTQGEHKVSRGFVPQRTWSMHWIVDPRFRAAIGDYLRREGMHVENYAQEVGLHVPYRDARREARGKENS